MDYAERSSSIEGRRIGTINGWISERRLKMQKKSKGMSETIRPHIIIRIIEDSKIPLEEEESKLQKIKSKVEHDEQLSREDESFLARLVERANEWQKGLRSSSDAEPEGHHVWMRNGEM